MASLTPPSAFEELRAAGNAAFATGCYADAVQAYSDASEACPTDATVVCNRSAAFLKLEMYGLALVDAVRVMTMGKLVPDSILRKAMLRAAKASLELFLWEHARFYGSQAAGQEDGIAREAFALCGSIAARESARAAEHAEMFKGVKLSAGAHGAENSMKPEDLAYMLRQAGQARIKCPSTVRDGPGGPRSVAVAQPLLDELCRGFPVEIRAGAHGFGVFARRDLKKDEVVLVDKCDLACHLDPTRCHHCTTRTSAKSRVPCFGHLKTGRPCALVFCSTVCRQAAWERYHAPLCGADTSQLDALVGRGKTASSRFGLVAWKALGVALRSRPTARVKGDETGETLPPRPYIATRPADMAPMNLLWRMTDSVGTPPLEQGSYMIDIWTMMRTSLQAIEPATAFDPKLDLQWLLDVFAMLIPNAVAVAIPGAKTILEHGTALMTAGTFFNHSCVPNTSYASNADATGAAFSCLPTRRIAAGEELTISYIHEDSPYEERKHALMGQYSFECRCPKCVRERPKTTTKATKDDATGSAKASASGAGK